MKALIKNIWEAPAKTMAGAIVSGLVALGGAWADAPPAVTISVAVLVAFIGAFAGPNKPNQTNA